MNYINLIYILSISIFALGFVVIIISREYLRKLVGLSIIQGAVLLLYIAAAKSSDGTIPIDKCLGLEDCAVEYSSAVPQVLMLTAIVVGFATMAVAIALIYRIKSEFQTDSQSESNFSYKVPQKK
ncbi:MAG: cation:proton antiporter subunit C [Rickettsiaceae bacterium]|nr:cation:proton antiporter subunit C [Rickettsiaceae bacterium]